jgi:hypothetical protein
MAVLAQEVTTVVCETQANIDAQEYFLLYGMGSDFEENSYHVWFNKGGSDADPAPSGSTGIECNISGATSASDVGAIVVTQVGGNADFGASNNSGTVTITNAVRGSVTDASNVNIGGSFSVTTSTAGTGTKNSNHTHPESDMAWFIQGDHLAVVTTKGSTSTSVHSKLGDWKGIDESVIEGFLIHYMAEPNAVSAITDTPDIDNTLHSFITDFVKCKLYMDRAGQLSVSNANSAAISMNLSSQHERKWKECLIKYGSKKRDKVGGSRRIMPPDIR